MAKIDQETEHIVGGNGGFCRQANEHMWVAGLNTTEWKAC